MEKFPVNTSEKNELLNHSKKFQGRFWNFGNKIGETITKIESNPEERKKRLKHLIRSKTNIAGNEFEKFFLDFYAMEKYFNKIEQTIVGDGFDLLCYDSSGKCLLYGIVTRSKVDWQEEKKKLIQLKEIIEEETGEFISKIYLMSIPTNLDARVKLMGVFDEL